MSEAALDGGEYVANRGSSPSLFATDDSFADGELLALRREVEDLRSKLASRTESWRQLHRQLSDAETALAQLRHELAAKQQKSPSDADWDRIVNPSKANSKS